MNSVYLFFTVRKVKSFKFSNHKNKQKMLSKMQISAVRMMAKSLIPFENRLKRAQDRVVTLEAKIKAQYQDTLDKLNAEIAECTIEIENIKVATFHYTGGVSIEEALSQTEPTEEDANVDLDENIPEVNPIPMEVLPTAQEDTDNEDMHDFFSNRASIAHEEA